MNLVVKPLISALPLWLRMHQNLRRYYDTRKRHPHLPNAFKYAFAHSIVIFGVFHPELLRFDGHNDTVTILFVAFFVTSTLYTFSWDVFMDWSLGDPKVHCYSVCRDDSICRFAARIFALRIDVQVARRLLRSNCD